jgi:endogenous inhibitor of DNA gyrase (YacG/DUF329 family)
MIRNLCIDIQLKCDNCGKESQIMNIGEPSQQRKSPRQILAWELEDDPNGWKVNVSLPYDFCSTECQDSFYRKGVQERLLGSL